MADVQVKFRRQRLDAFFAEFRRNSAEVAGASRAYVATIISFIIQDIDEHFQKERGPKGKWDDWSRAYEAHMRRKGKSGNKILQDTGQLRNNVRPGNWRRVPAGLEVFNPAKTKEGFPYAFAHDTGGPVLPQREFMWLSNKAMNRISAATVAYVKGKK